MYKKIVKKLVSNKEYFTEQSKISYSRTIGINEYSFMRDNNIDEYMQNIWFFSNDFENILIDYENKNKINNKNLEYKYTVKKLFAENKDELKDLSWIIVDYF